MMARGAVYGNGAVRLGCARNSQRLAAEVTESVKFLRC
jgi:hypothetical protein